jgi:hypothetical protein
MKENKMGKLAKQMSGQIQPGAKVFKKGGPVKSDAAQDKALFKAMDKGDKKCAGGKVKK